MKVASFKFDFLGCTSFVFQHDYTKPYITYNKVLNITFPGGEVLSFKEAEQEFLTQLSGIGNMGDFSSEILADLDELGYNLEQGAAVIKVDVNTLQEDILLNPGMFKLNGAPVPFTYGGFPDGVYEITFSYNEKPSTYTQKTNNIDGGIIEEPYTNTLHKMKMCGVLHCRALKIEEYFEIGCNNPINCNKRKQIMELINRMRILEIGAEYDFEVNDFAGASKKIEAMTTLCRTGNCNYNNGC